MSNLMCWNPRNRMLSMSDAIDRLFDDTFVMPREWGVNQPKVDVLEQGDNLVVKAELPGFDPNSIDVRCEGNLLTIRGEAKQENEGDEGKYHVRERRQSSFTRVIPLPSDVDADKAKAEFENGVLTLTLPIRESAKANQIKITAKSGGSDNKSSQSTQSNQTTQANQQAAKVG